MALIDEIKDVVANQLNIADKSKVTDTASFVDDLNADSLDLVELIMELEKRYDIKVPQEDQEKIKNVADAAKYIEEQEKKMATTTKNESWLNKALIKNNSKNLIRIVLSEKIDEKILSDVLIKLGLTRYGKKNSSYYEKCFYFVEHLSGSGVFGNSNTINLTRGSIIIDDKNSSIYIVGNESNFGIVEKKYCYINSNAGGLLSSMFSRISSISFYGDMAKLLINEKAIDREELYTKAGALRQKHKMKEPDINNIIKEISVRFGQDGKYFEWIDDSVELILVKHFIKLIMDKYNHVKLIVDKYKEELASNKSENNKEKVLDIEKLQSDILDKIKECGEKVESVKNLIKDFDYSSKSDYEKSCSKIEEDLAKCSENLNDANILNKINKIIDEINQVYKNVYYKKNDISSLASYMGDEENIDLIERLSKRKIIKN